MSKSGTVEPEKLYITSHWAEAPTGSFTDWAVWRHRLPRTLVVDELHDNHGNSLRDCTLFASVHGEQRAYQLTEEQCAAFLKRKILPLVEAADLGTGKDIEVPLSSKTVEGPIEVELHELEASGASYKVLGRRVETKHQRSP